MDYKTSNKQEIKTNSLYRASNLCYYAAFGAYTNPLSQKPRIETNFGEFRDYIKLARDVARQKEQSSASYSIIDQNKEYILSSFLCFSIKSKIVNDQITTQPDSFFENLKQLNIFPQEITVCSIQKNGIEIKPIKIGDSYFIEGQLSDEIIVNNNPLIAVQKELYHPISVIYSGKRIPVINNAIFIDNYSGDVCYDENIHQLVFKINKSKKNNDSDCVVLKLEENPNAEISIYDTFFTDDATEVYFDSWKDTYSIAKKDKEFGRLTIKTNGHRIKSSGTISLSVNVNQLNKQLDALIGLMKRPSYYQKPLLDLAENYDYRNGESGLSDFILRPLHLEYKILTDASRDGVDKQKDFVKKSLLTPDFMILQGPPGSGKTTAILELIYQLIKQGNKVLLCASTHVAIDNVLEKILTHPESKDLLRVIHPIRVGDEYNVYSEPVKPFIYENMISGVSDDFKRIVESSFNLVCGTTIGVLRYPPLAKMISEARVSTTKPLFDYMIIDEASKTTFSEFLVPAATAKRWIIVGDIKQLAPYVEKNDLKPTLLSCPALDKEYKRVGLSFLVDLKDPKRKNKMKNHIYILPRDAIEYIDNNLDSESNIIAVSSRLTKHMVSINGDDLDNNSPKIVALTSRGNIIFVDDNLAPKIFKYLNSEYTVLNYKEDITSLNLFQKYKVLRFKKMFSNTEFRDYKTEYPNFAKTRDVANEILWRLIRLYELNENQRTSSYYRQYLSSIENAITDSQEKQAFKKTIETLQGIAIPSIIMMLQEGIKSSSIKKASRIFGGLTEKEKENRFVMLDYQHRMHPDISAVSRKNVYNEEALKDYRRWTSEITDYPSSNPNRFEIRDVVNDEPVVTKNKNKAEVKAIIDELKKFIDFAAAHKKLNGKRYEIAVLSFYNQQVYALRRELQNLFKSDCLFNFYNDDLHVSLNSVDKFQGQEADIVYLSMVQNHRLGFLDSISRVNVAITRAKEKIIIFGEKEYYAKTQKDSDFLLDIFRRG